MRDHYFLKIAYLLFPILSLVSFSAYGLNAAGIVEVMTNVQNNVPALFTFVTAFAYVLGIWFIFEAMIKMKKVGQERTMMSSHTSMGKPVGLFFLGVGLIYVPTLINVSIQTLFTLSSNSILTYPVEPSIWDAVIHPLIDVIRLFGLISFIRGMVVLTRLTHEGGVQQGTLGKGIMHIIAGVLAINIVQTVDVIKATFGFS